MGILCTIRGVEQLESMDPRLTSALIALTKRPKLQIPLIYQYLHNPKESIVVDDDNKIGYVTEFKHTSIGIIGSVVLDILKTNSNQFQGVIDNLMVTINPNTKNPECHAFIVYDKDAKVMIDSRKQEQLKDLQLPKPGEIPLATEQVDMKDINKQLVEQFESAMKDVTQEASNNDE